ncbi:B3 domain-containing protein [Dendrobium catenatum]|uniref:B3 domain-containing protein n=1 Tax=Dendrobium catenatum TaxID=906689 RepID=A0A2I0X9J7_9ASPA|nr:B3 domain-containing protein [Dendrobium catenatum]
MSSSSAMATSGRKICFNTQCKKVITEQTRRKGWKLRSGDYSELCERCFSSFDHGNFCETFHSNAAGWRKCESCGKVSNQISSPPVALSTKLPERSKAFPVKSWNQVSGSFPGQWRHPTNIWNSSSIQSDLHQRLSYEFDRPNAERLMAGARSSFSSQEKKSEDIHEKIASSGPNHVAQDMNGENNLITMRKVMASDPSTSCFSGIKFEAHQISHGSSSVNSKGDSRSLLMGLSAPFSPINGTNDPSQVSTTQPQRQVASSTLSKQCYPNSLSSIDSTSESPAHMRNGKGRFDPGARSHLLPRYWPRITDQELQQISGDSNSAITPLFEKMLSASDAGRIGRLVLPKKCAEVRCNISSKCLDLWCAQPDQTLVEDMLHLEDNKRASELGAYLSTFPEGSAYFPLISQPEGLPLKMQDASGKEWVFQFRFWPNNNSRMYVLEGVTPCIQSMQLQAGDTDEHGASSMMVQALTFSRIDPEGKLVMGFRKAANVSNNEQDIQSAKDGNGGSTPSDVKPNTVDYIAIPPLLPHKGNKESRNQTNAADKASWSKNDKSEFILKDVCAPKFDIALCRRKGSFLISKSKRLRIESAESIELKLTWEEAQVLLRPALNFASNVVIVEGHDFEEYKQNIRCGINIMLFGGNLNEANTKATTPAIATGVMWSFVGGAGKPSVMHVSHPSQLWITTRPLNDQGAGCSASSSRVQFVNGGGCFVYEKLARYGEVGRWTLASLSRLRSERSGLDHRSCVDHFDHFTPVIVRFTSTRPTRSCGWAAPLARLSSVCFARSHSLLLDRFSQTGYTMDFLILASCLADQTWDHRGRLRFHGYCDLVEKNPLAQLSRKVLQRLHIYSPQELSMNFNGTIPVLILCQGSCKRSNVIFENENENVNENAEVIDGLDTLANLAILGEGKSQPSSSQPTTKHPRHRPGCTCIVCIQPPSGKGPKHKQTCDCNVCLTVKRRFRTLMLRREKRQSEKEAVISWPPPYPLLQNSGANSSPQMPIENNVVVNAESERKRTAPSPIKTQIDLNLQPEREEEPSPVANSENKQS